MYERKTQHAKDFKIIYVNSDRYGLILTQCLNF
jgi:hypothetical protein